MKKRIYGLETEYGIALIKKDGTWDCSGQALKPYLDYLQGRFSGARQFLANGSRIYLEMSYHPEYSTAECLDLTDLIAQDKAGDRILEKTFAQAVEKLKDENVKRIALFKNNVQAATFNVMNNNFTYGSHENFLMASKVNINDLADSLIPFLIARPIISGTGWTGDYQPRGSRYAISQRFRFINGVIGPPTHNHWRRAIFCTARWEETLADADKYRRLHLIMGDSNMSELAVFLKMGITGILLEMVEDGYPLFYRIQKFIPVDPVYALHSVSRDLTCKKPVIELVGGKRISAIDMLWLYVEMMAEYESARGLNPELSEALKILIDVLVRLGERKIDKDTLMEIDSRGLDEELDWLIKKSFLEHALKSFGCHWNNFHENKIDLGHASLFEKIVADDLKYHDISAHGLYSQYVNQPHSPSKLRKLGKRTPQIVDKEKIENMEESPPQNTRAKLRGDFVKFMRRFPGIEYAVDWNGISVTVPPPVVVHLNDPFAVENEKLASLKVALEQDAPR